MVSLLTLDRTTEKQIKQNQLLGKHVFKVSGAILSRPLSSYCSIASLLTLNMYLLANLVKSKSFYVIPMAIISKRIVF